jgi:hypothetical protein
VTIAGGKRLGGGASGELGRSAVGSGPVGVVLGDKAADGAVSGKLG